MESMSFPGQLLPRSSDQPLWPGGLAGAATAAASPLPVSTCQPFMSVYAETVLSKSPSLQNKDGVLGFMPMPRR